MNSHLTVADVYVEAEKQNMEILPLPMKKRVALVRPDGLLAIDYSKIESEEQEKEVLLEEIAHFCTYAFYPQNAPYSVWEKQEQKAIRFIFEKYYPPESIAGAMKTGAREPWEVAEHLSLPEQFVHEMLQYYTDIRGVDFNELTKEPEPDTTELEKQDRAMFEAMVRSKEKQKEKTPPTKTERLTIPTPKTEPEYGTKEYWEKQRLRARRAQLTGAYY
ncbi:hypothetical protein LJB76_02580 [Clostridia bacterium OttesenSCG-928-O13]|nr:hypothetical protein [Clostridia bacterium OttesenSCG-928-O13]